MLRFENVPESLIRSANDIQEKIFPELVNIKIKYLFDLKKNIVNGRICLGKCKKTDDLVKYFSTKEAMDEEGYQYIIILDKLAYDTMDETDRIRLLRHELRHVLVSERENGVVYKIYPHNIEDFIEEIELNADNPRWSMRIAQLVEDIYDQQAELAKEQK